MNYKLELDAAVDFAPSDEVREILQNVRTIIGTRRGSVPLDRDFGISWSFVDRTIDVAQMLLRAEIVDAVERYEPRARVADISFSAAGKDLSEGELKPAVTVSIQES